MLPYIGFIESYTLMIMLGIIGAFVVFEIYFRKHLKASKEVYGLEVSLLFAVVIGMICAYLFQNIYDFIEDPSSYSWHWSLTFYGGLIGGAGGFFLLYFIYGKKHYSLGLRPLLVIAPGSITLAHGIGRIGCVLAGCCYGIETNEWYGMQFPHHPHKVIPTNLFEAIFLLILSAILIVLAFKKDSEITMPIYLVSYGVWRFLIEFIRGDHRGSFVPYLSPSQFWSILMVLFGILYFIFAPKLLRKFDKSFK